MKNKNKSDQGKVDTNRRDLIKGMATAAVVGTVVTGTSTVVSANEKVTSKPEISADGYHETQHIRDYYDSL